MAKQQEIAKTDHRRQQVVEIMGDAPGKLTHSLHLLRLGELGLQPLLFGKVDDVADRAGKDATFVLKPREADRGHSLIAATDLYLDPGGRPIRKLEIREAAEDRIARLRSEQLGDLASFETVGAIGKYLRKRPVEFGH